MNLRDYERESIRRFVQAAADDGYFSGRVLDYGCGRQPYREIVEAARLNIGYEGFDLAEFPGNVSGTDVGDDEMFWDANAWDAILCTQVVQYVAPGADVIDLIAGLHQRLFSGGHLVLTYPTNWPEVEDADQHRFTRAGMERLLTDEGFTIVRHEARGSVHDPQFNTAVGKRVRAVGEEFVLGYGVVARA